MPFIVYNDRGIQKSFELLENKMIVFGREDHVEFQILKDSQVSREHFAIRKDDDDRFILIDLGASNGTSLNGKPLEVNSITILQHNDEIKAGRQKFIYCTKPLESKSAKAHVDDVAEAMDKGKGYHTIMCEILGKE